MNTTNPIGTTQKAPRVGTPRNEVPTKSDYRRRSFNSKIRFQDLVWGTQGFARISHLDDQENSNAEERDREQVDPKEKVEKVSDPNGKEPEKGPLPEDDRDINPNQPEPDDYEVDEEGSIIKEPTRDVDDPYMPGHNKDEKAPSKKEDLPDPEENTKTDY